MELRYTARRKHLQSILGRFLPWDKGAIVKRHNVMKNLDSLAYQAIDFCLVRLVGAADDEIYFFKESFKVIIVP